jgi:hypothetical protein
MKVESRETIERCRAFLKGDNTVIATHELLETG